MQLVSEKPESVNSFISSDVSMLENFTEYRDCDKAPTPETPSVNVTQTSPIEKRHRVDNHARLRYTMTRYF